MTKILWRLLGFWRPHLRVLIFAYGSMFAGAALAIAIPVVIRYAIDEGVTGRDKSALLLAAGLILLFQGLRAVFLYFRQYLTEYTSQQVAFEQRNRLNDRIQSLSFAYHDRAETGQLMSRVTADVENSRALLSAGLLQLILTLGHVLLIAAIMVFLNWQLAILILLTTPAITIISITTTQKLRPIALAVQQQIGAYTAVLQESLAGIRVVQAFAAEARQSERFQAANWGVRERSLEQNGSPPFGSRYCR